MDRGRRIIWKVEAHREKDIRLRVKRMLLMRSNADVHGMSIQIQARKDETTLYLIVLCSILQGTVKICKTPFSITSGIKKCKIIERG